MFARIFLVLSKVSFVDSCGLTPVIVAPGALPLGPLSYLAHQACTLLCFHHPGFNIYARMTYGHCWNTLLLNSGLKLHSRNNYLRRISGSHGGEYEDGCLLGCSAV
jgi:hypothetical protein